MFDSSVQVKQSCTSAKSTSAAVIPAIAYACCAACWVERKPR